MSTRRDKLQEGSGISAALRPRGQLDGLPSSVTGCPTARVLCPVWRPALAPRVMGYPTACDRLTSPCIDGLGCRLSVWCPRERHRQIAPPTGHTASQCSGPCPPPPHSPKPAAIVSAAHPRRASKGLVSPRVQRVPRHARARTAPVARGRGWGGRGCRSFPVPPRAVRTRAGAARAQHLHTQAHTDIYARICYALVRRQRREAARLAGGPRWCTPSLVRDARAPSGERGS